MGYIEDFAKVIGEITDFKLHLFDGASEEELLELERELFMNERLTETVLWE